MTEFRRVTDQLSVSPQIALDDLARAAGDGFKLVINNRPDGEEPGQPTSAEVEAAAAPPGWTMSTFRSEAARPPTRSRPTTEPSRPQAGRSSPSAAQAPVRSSPGR